MPETFQLGAKISTVEKDVAVLQSEVSHYGKIMERLDVAINSMAQVSNNLERLLIVHEERIKNTAENLEDHKRVVGLMSDDFIDRMDTLGHGLRKRLEKLEEHKEQVDKWRWHIGGVWAAICVMAGFLGKLTGLW